MLDFIFRRNRIKVDGFWQGLDFDRSSWQAVASVCAGKAAAVRAAWEMHVPELARRDFDRDKLHLSGADYALQLLGSEYRVEGLWRWAWAERREECHRADKPALRRSQLQAAERLRELGKREGIGELTAAELQLSEEVNGGTLSAVACGLLKGICVIRCPREDGADFFAVTDAPPEVFFRVEGPEFMRLTMQELNALPPAADHRLFVESFLAWNRTSYRWQGRQLIASFREPVRLTFEEEPGGARLTDMESPLLGRVVV